MSSTTRALQTARLLLRNRPNVTRQPKRLMGGHNDVYYYRSLPQHPKYEWFLSALPPFVVVFIMGYNFYHHWRHLLGEHPEIVPENFTDEELGIPPDDADVYPPGYTPASK